MGTVEDWAEVGDLVRRARHAAAYSQADLARRVDLDRTAVVKIETGARHVSALELTRIAAALELPLSYFVNRSPKAVTAYRASSVEASTEPETDNDRARFRLDVELEEHARDAHWLINHGFLRPPAAFRAPQVADRNEAVALAWAARKYLDAGTAPLGSMAVTSERFGLYVKVVPRGTGGASLSWSTGQGVAAVGSESDPGRRRATAAHELGHHLWGDAYNTDVGVAAADSEKEALVDAFAADFLLPSSVVEQIPRPGSATSLRSALIDLAAEYRVSWRLAVNSARVVHALSSADVRELSSRPPLRGDFLEVAGYEPQYDLATASTGPAWRRAVLTAYRARAISPERTLEMVNGSLGLDDLPALDEAAP